MSFRERALSIIAREKFNLLTPYFSPISATTDAAIVYHS